MTRPVRIARRTSSQSHRRVAPPPPPQPLVLIYVPDGKAKAGVFNLLQSPIG